MPDTAATENAFWAAEYQPDNYGPNHKRGLYLYVDMWTAPDSVVLKCNAWTAYCAGNEVWTAYSGIAAGQWYTYTVYWDLPIAVADGLVQVWWDGVLTVNDNTVVTGGYVFPFWYGTNRIYNGMVEWHSIFSDNKTFYTDAIEDCRCKIVGNVTPAPP